VIIPVDKFAFIFQPSSLSSCEKMSFMSFLSQQLKEKILTLNSINPRVFDRQTK